MPITPAQEPVDVVINPINESPKVKDFIINSPLIVQSINVKNKFDSLDYTAENLSQRVLALDYTAENLSQRVLALEAMVAELQRRLP
jgi:hypothetical protein